MKGLIKVMLLSVRIQDDISSIGFNYHTNLATVGYYHKPNGHTYHSSIFVLFNKTSENL